MGPNPNGPLSKLRFLATSYDRYSGFCRGPRTVGAVGHFLDCSLSSLVASPFSSTARYFSEQENTDNETPNTHVLVKDVCAMKVHPKTFGHLC